MRLRETNGEIVDVPVDDLFFSATNVKGIIKEANDVFVNISRYKREELLGKPHNIVRHPDMPGGSFREMWYRLHDGKSFGGYFRNLTPEGACFDVYATVTPIPNSTDFLSVRQRCCHNDNFQTTLKMFKQIRDREYEWMAQGLGTNDVIEHGRDYMMEILPDYGFANYDAYQNEMLPWEVYCREGMSEGLPQRPNAEPDQLRRLGATHAIHKNLDQWMAGLENILETAKQLNTAKDHLLGTLGRAVEVQERIKAVNINSTELQVLSFQLNVWTGMQSIVDGYINDVVSLLEEVVSSSMTARFDISVARLHATMLASFMAEIIDGRGNIEDHERQLDMLRTVVRHSVSVIDRNAFDRAQYTRRSVKKLRALVGIMESPCTLLSDALSQAETTEQSDVFAAVEDVLNQAQDSMNEISRLAQRLENDPIALDIQPIYTELDKLSV